MGKSFDIPWKLISDMPWELVIAFLAGLSKVVKNYFEKDKDYPYWKLRVEYTFPLLYSYFYLMICFVYLVAFISYTVIYYLIESQLIISNIMLGIFLVHLFLCVISWYFFRKNKKVKKNLSYNFKKKKKVLLITYLYIGAGISFVVLIDNDIITSFYFVILLLIMLYSNSIEKYKAQIYENSYMNIFLNNGEKIIAVLVGRIEKRGKWLRLIAKQDLNKEIFIKEDEIYRVECYGNPLVVIKKLNNKKFAKENLTD